MVGPGPPVRTVLTLQATGKRHRGSTARHRGICHYFGVRRADLVLVGAVVLALVTGLGMLLWPQTGSESYRVARGTVLQPAHCGPPEARDSLRVELLDGREVLARLDGCGNLPGEVLTVEVPDPLPVAGPSDGLVVRLAGTGVPATTANAQRLTAVLVAVAGMAGAVLAWRLKERSGARTRADLHRP